MARKTATRRSGDGIKPARPDWFSLTLEMPDGSRRTLAPPGEVIAAFGWREMDGRTKPQRAWTCCFRNLTDAALALLRLQSYLHVQAIEAAAGRRGKRDRARLLGELEYLGGWQLMLHGQLDVLREAVAVLDRHELADYPRLRLGRILAMCKDDRLPLAEQDWADFMHEYVRGLHRNIPRWEVGILRELVAGYAGTPPNRARLDALHQLVRDIPPGDPGARGAVANIQLHVAVEIGDIAAARRYARIGLSAFRQAHSIYGELFIHVQCGLAEYRAGRMAVAQKQFMQAHALARSWFDSDAVLVALTRAMLSIVAYEHNDPAAAGMSIEHDLTVVETGEGWTESLWLLYRVAMGLAAQSRQWLVLRRARELARRRGLRRLDTLLGLREIEWLLDEGRPELVQSAARLRLDDIASRNLALDASWHEAALRARLLRATIALRSGESVQADPPARITRDARACGMPELLCAALVLEMEAAIAGGDSGILKSLLAEFLDHVGMGKCWRSLLDMPSLVRLWPQLPDATLLTLTARKRSLARQLAKEIQRVRRQCVAGGQAVTFSAIELRVLSALGKGMRNKEIAKRLTRCEDTVKFHLKQISRKLDVRGRREIVQRAQELGVLD